MAKGSSHSAKWGKSLYCWHLVKSVKLVIGCLLLVSIKVRVAAVQFCLQ